MLGTSRQWILSVSLATAGLALLLFLAEVYLGPNMSLAAEVSFEIITDKDAPGHDYQRMKDVSLEDCRTRCLEEIKCAAFTYNHRRRTCFLKNQTAPKLVDYRGATTGLKQELQEADQSGDQPKSNSRSPVTKADVTSRQLNLPDQPVILVKPNTQIASATKVCTLFDSDFALITNPKITLKFDQIKGTAVGADKALMFFYNQGAKILSGSLIFKDNRFSFIKEESSSSVSRDVVILDSINPSGNYISDPVFVVVGGLPFNGGVFRRIKCETP
jgi:hypothetical protein